MTRVGGVHVGAVVILPNGHAAKVTSRHGGPVQLWAVNDGKPCWRDDQLRLADDEEERVGISPQCRNSHHERCGGGFSDGGELYACTCSCGHGTDERERESK